MADAAPEWEVSKENFQPTKAGRASKGLATPKQEVPRAVLADTEERRQTFDQELAEYAGDDPLEVWIRYIKWVQQAHPTGGAKAQLVPLLERCTRELEGLPRYRGDHRYLRLWILYADNLPEPQDVFTYLRDKGIGQEQALYYTAYATFLEMRGAHARARDVYRDGLAKYAAPLDQLRKKSEEFEARMVKREERRARGEAPPADAEAVSRATFGELPTKARLRARAGTAARPPRGGLAPARRPVGADDAENAAPPSNAGGDLAIFTDPEFGGAEDGPAYSAPRSTLDHLPTFEAGRKENALSATPWAGAQLPQRRGAAVGVTASAPALEIPVDEDLANAQPLPLDPQQKPLRKRLDGGADLQRTLEHDPLRLRTAPLPSATATPPPPQQQPQSRKREARETVYAYDAPALNQNGGGSDGGADTQEMCFEELRARHLQRKQVARAAGGSDSQAAAEHPVLTAQPSPQQQHALQQLTHQAAPATVPLPPPQTLQLATMPQAATSAFASAPPAAEVLAAASVPQVNPLGGAAAAAALAVSQPVPAVTPSDAQPDRPAVAEAAAEADSVNVADQHAASQPAQPSTQPTAASNPCQQPPASSAAVSPAQQPPGASGVSAMDAENAAPSPAARSPSGKRKRGCGLALRPTPQQSDATPAAASPVGVPAGPVAVLSPDGAAGGRDDTEDIFAGAFSGPVLEQAHSAAALEPTLTVNTREAWDAINGMFSAALPHEEWGCADGERGADHFMAQERAAAEARWAAASAGAQRPPLPRRASMGTGPGGRRTLGGDSAATASLAAARARRSRRSSILPSAFTQPIMIREDTEYLSFDDGIPPPASGTHAFPGIGGGGGHETAPVPSAVDETGPLPMYEDTQFLTRPLAGSSRQSSGSISARGRTSAGGGSGSLGGGDDSTGLLVREDTCFLPDAPVAAASAALEQTGDLQLYEDTGFLAENLAPRTTGPQAVTSHPAPAAAAAMDPSGGLQLYEDTSFLSENVAPQPAGPQAVSSHPASAAAAALEPTGGLQLYEDTSFLTENVAPRSSVPLGEASQSPAAAAEQEFDEEGENQPPVGAVLQPLPGMANGHAAKPPLQALGDAEAAARGISIGTGVPEGAEGEEQWAVPPAAALAQAGSAEQDDFEVFRDT